MMAPRIYAELPWTRCSSVRERAASKRSRSSCSPSGTRCRITTSWEAQAPAMLTCTSSASSWYASKAVEAFPLSLPCRALTSACRTGKPTVAHPVCMLLWLVPGLPSGAAPQGWSICCASWDECGMVCRAAGICSEPHQAAGQGRPPVQLAPAHVQGLRQPPHSTRPEGLPRVARVSLVARMSLNSAPAAAEHVEQKCASNLTGCLACFTSPHLIDPIDCWTWYAVSPRHAGMTPQTLEERPPR